MEKEDIIAAFETEFQDPGAIKSGEYLEEHIFNVARDIVTKDRLGLIVVMREWLALRKEPETMLAVSVAKEMKLAELTEDLHALRIDIEQLKLFMPWYVRRIDQALAVIVDHK